MDLTCLWTCTTTRGVAFGPSNHFHFAELKYYKVEVLPDGATQTDMRWLLGRSSAPVFQSYAFGGKAFVSLSSTSRHDPVLSSDRIRSREFRLPKAVECL